MVALYCIQYMLNRETVRGLSRLHYYTAVIKVCKLHPENQCNITTLNDTTLIPKKVGMLFKNLN